MALSRKPIEIVDQGNHQLLTKANHWERAPLSDVSIVQNGFAFKSELFTHSEGKPLIRIRDIEDGWTENFYSGEYLDEFVVRKGDILIGMDGDFNAAIWQGIDGLLNQRVCRLIPTSKNFSGKFLFLCLQPYLNAINAETSSVTVKHLSSKTIGDIPLPLPPINEQHRVVAKTEELFSELDKGIENLKTARAQLKVYRQALLKHAFEGKLTAQWRAERSVTPAKAGVQPLNDMDSRLRGNDEPLETADALLKRIQQERAQRYQQQLADWQTNGSSKPKVQKLLPPLTAEELAELPELPDGWRWMKYGDLCSIVRNGISAKPEGESGTPIFRISAVRSLFFDMADIRFIDNTTGEFDSYCLERGDLVFTRYNGSRRYVGVCAEYRSHEKRLFPDKLVQTRVFSKNMSTSYLEKALNCGASRKFVESKIRTTAGQSGVSGDDIKNIPVPFCSTDEQIQIVEELESKLSEVDQLDQTITTSLQQAETLRQSILKKAFSGQLVAQDASDEPASVLLERIKTERAKQSATPKPRKPQKAQPAPGQTNVIPFPAKLANISTTDLHAGILARAYQHHAQDKNNLVHFGRVKAEKIAHLVEASLGIDLGREPIKDVAGPNDYPHLMKVESRARKANWFDVRKKKDDDAYELSKRHGFNGLLLKTRNALGERANEVDALINLLLPMNKQQVEIVATLYAAWNNLLLLRKVPCDEEIVYEARENWHESKLKIKRERFFSALGWMRLKNLVPGGKGRYVEKKK